MSCFWILNTTFFVRHFCFTFLFMDALTEREWLGQYWCWLRAALPSVLCKPNWRPNCIVGLMGASLRRRTPHTAHAHASVCDCITAMRMRKMYIMDDIVVDSIDLECTRLLIFIFILFTSHTSLICSYDSLMLSVQRSFQRQHCPFQALSGGTLPIDQVQYHYTILELCNISTLLRFGIKKKKKHQQRTEFASSVITFDSFACIAIHTGSI